MRWTPGLSEVTKVSLDLCAGLQVPRIMEQGVADGPCPANNITTRRPTLVRYEFDRACRLLVLGCEKLEISNTLGGTCDSDYQEADIFYYKPLTVVEDGLWMASYKTPSGASWSAVHRLRCSQ